MDPGSLDRRIERLEALTERAEGLLPPPPPPTDLDPAIAYRRRATLNRGSRSGRSACRFARGRVRRRQLGETG